MATSRSHATDRRESGESSSRKKPCRSCLDFKAWRAQMQGNKNAASDSVIIDQLRLLRSLTGYKVASLLHGCSCW